jgi:WD40 repeat protein
MLTSSGGSRRSARPPGFRMRLSLPVLLYLVAPLPAADPPGLIARLGSDRFRQANRIDAIAYSPDGKHLATADGDSIVIWDAADGRRLRTVPVGNHEFFALRYAPDGRNLYAAAAAGGLTRLCRIDPAGGKLLDGRHLLTGKSNGRFSRDGSWLAIRNQEGSLLEAVDTSNPEAVWTDRVKGELYSGYAWRGDGKVLAAATVTGRVRLHDARSGKLLHEYRLEGGPAWSMAFSPDGKDLVAEIGAPDRVVRFVAATGEVKWKYDTVRADELTFTPDGRAVFYWGTAGSRRRSSRWHWLDADTGKPLRLEMDTEYGHSVAIRPDGNVLAVGGLTGLISQWDLTTRKRLDTSADPPEPVTDLRFSADGTKVRGWARGWYEWDAKTGQQVRLTPRLDVGANEPIAVSHDQKWLGRFAADAVADAGNSQRRFELVDLTTGKRQQVLPGIDRGDRFRFLPDGRLLVVRESDLNLFDPATGRRVLQLETGPGRTVVVSADGTAATAVSRSDNGVWVTWWDVRAGKKSGDWIGTVTPQGVLKSVEAVNDGLSPDGRLLMIQFTYAESEYHRAARRIGVFDARTGRKVSEWEPRQSMRPVYSPDGRSVVCLSGGTAGIDLQEVITGGRRAESFGSRAVDACRFRPDGKALVISTRPGPVEVWDLPGPHFDRTEAWDPAKADQVWTALAAPDAAEAFAAIRRLQSLPTEAAVFLKARVNVPAGPSAEWVAERIRALDAPLYRDREKATAELARAGEEIEGQLRDAQATAPAEARERLKGLLAKAETMTPEKLRVVRACEVLEGIGSTEALEVLATWAKGPHGAGLTREAAESLARLKERGK